jgi:serine/threonine-protein kinase
MAPKDPHPEAKAGQRGLLGWLRSEKQAEPTERHLVVHTTPKPVDLDDYRPLTREVELRHVDRGEIAKGGMGSIRKVFDNNLLRTVAMKVLFPEHRKDAKTMQRFLEEAQIMGQLEHPNIVPVHDLAEDFDGTRYFTMLYVRGKTLTEILASDTTEHGSHEGYFKLLQIFTKVCDAGAFAHSRGVVHRDLKPDNIMVGAFGEVYLMDWGIAKLLGGNTPAPMTTHDEASDQVRVKRDAENADDETGQIIGTFYYMSPEQAFARIDDIDERTDVFLLGGVLYEILTGQPPFMGESVLEVVRAAQACRVVSPERLAPERHIPAQLARICLKCLQRERSARYQSVSALKNDIELFLQGGASFPTMTWKAGELLMKEGDKGDQVFIINKGLVQVYKTDADGRRHGLATLGPGSVVGEAAVMSGGARVASVLAVEDVVATAVTQIQLEKELGINSWMGSLVKALAQRFMELDDKLDEARVEQQQLKLDHWLFDYLLANAEVGPGGDKEVVLSTLVRACRKKLNRSEPEVRKLIASNPRLKVDASRDRVAYQPAGPSS